MQKLLSRVARRPLLGAGLLTAVVIGAAAPIAGLTGRPPMLQGVDEEARKRKYGNRITEAWIPPGRYSAIVIATNGTTRRWIISLRTTNGRFPITVPPLETTIIPFDEPWVVLPQDQARLESIDVPFDDISRDTPLAESNLCLSAWGITDKGPVAFVIRPERR